MMTTLEYLSNNSNICVTCVVSFFFFFLIQAVFSPVLVWQILFFFLIITRTFWLLCCKNLDPSKIFYFSKQSPFLFLASRYWPTFLSYSFNDNLIFKAFEMLFLICFVCLVALGLLLIPAGAICEAENSSPGWTSLFSRPWESVFSCLWLSAGSCWIPAWASGHLGWLPSVSEGEGDSSP